MTEETSQRVGALVLVGLVLALLTMNIWWDGRWPWESATKVPLASDIALPADAQDVPPLIMSNTVGFYWQEK